VLSTRCAAGSRYAGKPVAARSHGIWYRAYTGQRRESVHDRAKITDDEYAATKAKPLG